MTKRAYRKIQDTLDLRRLWASEYSMVRVAEILNVSVTYLRTRTEELGYPTRAALRSAQARGDTSFVDALRARQGKPPVVTGDGRRFSVTDDAKILATRGRLADIAALAHHKGLGERVVLQRWHALRARAA